MSHLPKYLYKWLTSGFLFITILLPLHANLTLTPPIEKYIIRLEKEHNLNKQLLTSTLKKATIQPHVLQAIQQPSEKKPWYLYRNIFLTSKRIKHGVSFWKTHQKTLERAEKNVWRACSNYRSHTGCRNILWKIHRKV